MQVITLIRQVNALCCSALTVLEVKLECVQGSAAVEVRRTRVPAVELLAVQSPVLESTVLQSPVLKSKILESTVLE